MAETSDAAATTVAKTQTIVSSADQPAVAFPRTLTLVSSDGQSFIVPESAAVQSMTIKNMVEEGCADDPIPLSNVTAKVLSPVIMYLINNVGESEEKNKFNDEVFLAVSVPELFEYVMAANYLDISSLMDLVSQKIADTIKDKSPASVRKLFGIENDYTAEEEEAVKKEYLWAFDGMEED